MNRIFGKKKEEPKKEAYTGPSLTETSEKMDGRVTELDAKIAKCDEDIKNHMSKARSGQGAALSKNRALQALKRKKMLEQQRNQIMGTQFNIEAMAFQQENMQTTMETVGAMKAGAETMKEQMGKFDIDDLAEMQDDMADMMMDMEEINEMMSRNYTLDGMDDATLDDEFAALEEEMKMEEFDSMMTGGTTVPSYLPSSTTGPAADAPAKQAEEVAQ